MDYDEIPSELYPYINATEEEYNATPPNIRNVLLRDAEERYRNTVEDDDDIQHEPFPMDTITIRVEETNERIRLRGRKYKWRRRDVIGEASNPIVLTPDNVEDFGRQLDALRDQYTTDGFAPAQYILTGNGYYENTSPNSSHLMAVIEFRLEEYEDGRYVVDGFVIRFKRGYQREEHHGGITAGKGEGVPRKLNSGYWILDIIQAKNKCIPNAYVLWKMYVDGCVDKVIQGDRKEFIQRRRSLPSGHGIKFNDVMHEGEEFNILYHEERAWTVSPQDTRKTCWFVYTNGHVGLLVHEDYLKEKSIATLEKLSQRTVLHQILQKKVDADPIDIVTADIESFRRLEKDGSEKYSHEPLLIGQYNGKRFTHFRGEDAMDRYCKYLSDSGKDWLIWCHNGGRYDAHFLLKPMLKYCDTSLDLPMQLRDLKGNLLEIRAHLKNGHVVIFRDSCSLIPGSLAELAKDMKVTRKMGNVDIKNASREEILTSPKILEYNRLDCVSLYEILLKYQSTSTETFGTNPLHHVSASSFAKKIFFSTYYNPKKHPLYVLPKKVRDFIAEGYCGGRNEMFHRGRFIGKEIFPYDFTSFYSAVGRGSIPYGIPRWKDNLKGIKGKDSMEKFLKENPGFYEVEILYSPRDKIPLHGTFREHRYVFPYFVNCRAGKIFSEELLLGLSIGYRYRLLCGYTQPLAPICAKFFEDLIKVKTDANKDGLIALGHAAKNTANAGYGYFGFSPYNRNVMKVYGEDMVEHLESLADNGRLSYRKEEDAYICYETTNVLLSDINVAVAAAITSHARMRLWELMQDITDAGGKVYYCDTDSVYSSIDIVKHKTLGPKWCGVGKGKNLGELKRELPLGEDVDDITFVGCKTYGYKTNKGKYHVKSKGTNNPKPMYEPKEDDEKYEDPNESHDKDVGEYERNKEMYEKLHALLTEPQIFPTNTMSTSRIRKATKDMKVYDEVVPKKISGVYTKGHVLSNGEVKPLKLAGKFVVEPPISDSFVQKLFGGSPQLVHTYESDYEGDDDYYVPKDYLDKR